MEYTIVLTQTVYEQIHTLMFNNDKLNEGSEIGGWLLGDWRITDKNATLLLDTFIIPKQTVTKVEVDIGPESMIDTIKEIGPEASNRIKAHWHIHPFGKGPTDWSGIDEQKITDFMDPTKQRNIFVFLLSSEDQLKARVECICTKKNLFTGEIIYERGTLNNLPVYSQNNIANTTHFDYLEKRIKEKVEQRKYVAPVIKDNSFYMQDDYYTKSLYDYSGIGDYQGTIVNVKEKQTTKSEYYDMYKNGDRVIVNIYNPFAEFVNMQAGAGNLLDNPDETIAGKDMWSLTYIIGIDMLNDGQLSEKQAAMALCDDIETELQEYVALYEEEEKLKEEITRDEFYFKNLPRKKK